ncbi:NfeD family protein [[Eubacterium] cellulosolvens]
MSRSVLKIFLVLLFFLAFSLSTKEASPGGSVILIKVEDTITPATAEMVIETIEEGKERESEAIILLLNTPGGQLDATIKIVESIESSTVPVVAFVYPEGAKAWSAGTLILMSSHIAAMAPHTIIGSAQPVAYSPFGGAEPVEDKKVVNAISLFIVERARMHGRNETAARLFVEENLNLNTVDALRMEVVEVSASSPDKLLKTIDKYSVDTANGPRTLRTSEAQLVDHSPSVRIILLTAISNPLLAYILFTVGFYALAFGLASPGYGGEVIGGIAILAGLIGFGFDINLGALLMAGLGAILLIAEAYTPGFGLFGGAGLFCLIIGSFLIAPFTPSKWLLSTEWYNYFLLTSLGVAAILGGFTLFMIYKIFQARIKKPVIGTLIGAEVDATEDIEVGKLGFVRFKGEYWRARAEEKIKADSRCLIISKDGPILVIKPAKKSNF